MKNFYCKYSFLFNFKLFKIIILILAYLFFKEKIKTKYFENIKDIADFQKNIYLINKNHSKLDYENNTFAILKRNNCPLCGFFSYYCVFIECVIPYIINGDIPIIDLNSYGNIYNNFKPNISENPWELYFHQPFGYKLNEVKKKAKKIKYYECFKKVNSYDNIYNYKNIIQFWHNISKIFFPLKKIMINKAKKIRKKLFNNSQNLLGILIRGTDFISSKTKSHPIPPKPEIVIRDVKKMDKENKYKFLFIATEDDLIREKFKKEFGNKIKFLQYKKKLNWDYNSTKFLGQNALLIGNKEFTEIYILNIIILSKCLDIIGGICNGLFGVFTISNGFRNTKIYDLGVYN